MSRALLLVISATAIIFAGCDSFTGANETASPNDGGEPFTAALDEGSSAQGIRANLFGPRQFRRTKGKPEEKTVQVTGDEFSTFEPPFVLHVQNGDSTGSRRISSAWIWLDGTLLFGPNAFSQQVGTLRKEVSIEEESELTVKLAGKPDGFLDVRIEGTRVASQERIGPDGGTVELEGVSRFEFPAGLFPSSRLVRISQVEDEDATEQFEMVAEPLFRVATKTSSQVRVLAGETAPKSGTFTAVFGVPEDLEIPPGHQPKLFARNLQTGGLDTLDTFRLFPATFDADSRTLTAMLPSYLFTDERREDGFFEALFTIATIPSKSTSSALKNGDPSFSTRQSSEESECEAAFIACPLAAGCEEISPFGVREDPVSGEEGDTHWGVDLEASNGDEVTAPADGTIQRIPKDPDGYGRYLILRHEDGSATLYAHLQETKVAEEDTVDQGDVIALSDNTGRTTGPHLHFEYVPNGRIVLSERRIDPLPCIKENAGGSITVRDNGNLADDAFSVFLDDALIGTTEIGGSNSFAVNNIIPGNYTLTLAGETVPDDVGTYEVVLSDGVTFSDGTVRRSGVVGLNESVSFSIVVPEEGDTKALSTQSVSPSDLMQPNTVTEGRK